MLSNVTQNTYCAVSNNHPCLGLGLIISPRPEAWRLLLDVSFNVSKVRNGKPFKIVDSRVNMSDLVNFLGNVNLARFRDLISRLQVHERTTYLALLTCTFLAASRRGNMSSSTNHQVCTVVYCIFL